MKVQILKLQNQLLTKNFKELNMKKIVQEKINKK